jgi:hypothetical protein
MRTTRLGQGPGLAQRVGDGDRRHRQLGHQRADQRDQRALALAVEGRERLVEEDDPRGHGQGPGQGHPLGLAARVRARAAARQVADPELGQERVGPLAALGARHRARQRVADVAEAVEVREQRQVLEQVGAVARLDRQGPAGRGVDPHLVAQGDPAAGRRHQAADDAQERALAGARRTEHAGDAGAKVRSTLNTKSRRATSAATTSVIARRSGCGARSRR